MSKVVKQYINPFAWSQLTRRMAVLLAGGILSLLILQIFPAALHTLEERLGDLGWTLAPETAVEQRITIVSIDEASLDAIGPWPWSRQIMAELTRAIDESGAQLQLHDIVYSEAREGDEELLAALQQADAAVLAQVPVLQGNQAIQTGRLSHPLTGIACNSALPATENYLAPASAFAGIAKGHITPMVDADGAIRNSPAIICINNEAYPLLAVSALLQAIDAERWQAELTPATGPFDPAYTLSLSAYPGLRLPLAADGSLRISYRRDPASYRAVSAVDVLRGNIEPGMFDNAWVLVGATAFGMGDVVPTPFNGAAPGVELQARMLGSLLDVNIPYTPISAGLIQLLLAGFAAALLLTLAGREGKWTEIGLPLAAVGLPVSALALHIGLLSFANVWLGWLAPALFSVLAAAGLLLLELATVRMERARVFGNLSSYLPGDLAREIAYALPNSNINARRIQATILSADLRNFSAFGENRPPEESAAVLHFFFTRATRIIEKHGGRVNEFKGDALLAVWSDANSAAASSALAAARELQQQIRKNALLEHAPQGLEPLAVGIGIEQGPVLAGSLGPAHRRSHALLGDTVTIALRIQDMTAELAQPILLGPCVARQLNEQALESQGSYLLAGLTTPHTLFAPEAAGQDLDGISVTSARPELKVVSGGKTAARE
jgi:CHASE2 domain-containing sensor protein/class 3 adenylate cyclase